MKSLTKRSYDLINCKNGPPICHISRKSRVQSSFVFETLISPSKIIFGPYRSKTLLLKYSVIHNSIAPSKELCSKMTLGEVGVSLP